ncbi:MAG: hypothetical protein K6G17_09805 [Oscillospiraceae bacterium]|nr:hypothetical protein [Oscillospiraceae bacterium]
MKKAIALLLALLALLTLLAGCGGEEDEPGGRSEKAPESETAAQTDETPKSDEGDAGEATAEAAPEETPDPTLAVLKLGKDELEIRITGTTLDENGILTVVFDGITLKSSWRSLKVDAVVDGEAYFLEVSNAASDGYSRSSGRAFEKLPEKLLVYEAGSEAEALVYDVAEGVFVK